MRLFSRSQAIFTPIRQGNRRWSRGGCLAARLRIGPPCPILHLAGDSHARCSPAARHRLDIRDELGNGTAGGRWGPRLPGQPPSSLVPHALVRMALAIIQRPIGALWARHADTHPQADTLRSRVYTMRRYGVRPTFSQLVSLRRESVFARLLAGVTLVTPTC